MKLSTKLLVAAVCIAIPAIAYNKVMSLFPEGRGFDIWPEAEYRVEGTDYMEYQDLRFAVNDERFSDLELSVSSTMQMLWDYVVPSHIAAKLFHSQTFKSDKATTILDAYFKSTQPRPNNILDARTRDLDFEKTGFDLITDDDFLDIDWSNIEDPEVMEQLKSIMIPYIKSYYPTATRLQFSPPILRLATSLRAVNAPHIDYVPDDDMRAAFHEKNPVHEHQKLMPCLLGACDTDEDELAMILGAWIPTIKTPVCDKPLAVMDASTCRPEDVAPIVSRAFLFRKTLSQMWAVLQWRPEQQWYYYSEQKSNEMLLFHHYNKDKSSAWANPHTSLTISGCGDEYESRASTEMRVIVFFPKNDPAIGNATLSTSTL